MESQPDGNRELAAECERLRHHSMLLQERLRAAEWDAQGLRGFAIEWIREQRKLVRAHAFPPGRVPAQSLSAE